MMCSIRLLKNIVATSSNYSGLLQLVKKQSFGHGSRAFSSAAASSGGTVLAQGVGSSTPSSAKRWSLARRLALTGFLTPAAAASIWIATSDEPAKKLKLLWAVPLRLGRDITTAAAIVADYSYSLHGLPLESPEREKAKHECHLRGADRLQKLLFNNGGIYIKLGQHIGQLDYLLPEEYVHTMRRVMLDKCPTSSYAQVCALFLADLGKLPSQIYAEFDPEPFASASLAQVHRATLPDGQRVAVKVQHSHLTDTARADTLTVKLVVNALYWLFPSYDYRWLIDEVQESLPKELDFLNEASNAEACGANFRALSPRLRRSVAVPAMHRQLCSRRILTMEFMDGVSVTDVAAIKALGLRPADVAKLVSEAFGEMIFHHGFVHCDPHAANLLVRLEPSPSAGGGNGGSGSSKRRSKQAGRARPQLVLLDHGLYRTLPPAMRFNYASLWKALVFADVEHIKQHSAALGAGDDLFTIFAAVLTMRTWERVAHSSLDHLQAPDTPAERAELQLNAKRYAREITELLARLPRVVLLLLKTNDCLRAVDNALGAPINTFVITGRQCTHALAEIQRAEAPSIWSSMRADLQIWHAEFRIFQLQAIACLLSLRQRLLRWLYDRLPYETPAVHLS